VNPVTIGNAAEWDAAYGGVRAIFEWASTNLFANTYLGYFMILSLSVGVAVWLYRLFKSI
jgi:hypothetical protein